MSFDEEELRRLVNDDVHRCFYQWGTSVEGKTKSEMYVVLYCSCGTTVGQVIDFEEVSNGEEKRT